MKYFLLFFKSSQDLKNDEINYFFPHDCHFLNFFLIPLVKRKRHPYTLTLNQHFSFQITKNFSIRSAVGQIFFRVLGSFVVLFFSIIFKY